jgi:hypothetical protein
MTTTQQRETRPAVEPSPDPSPAPVRRPRPLAPVVWGVALIAIGTGWLLELVGIAVPWEALLPVAVLVIGISLLVLSRTGGHGGLIVLGAVLTVLASVTAVVEGPFGLGVGDRYHAPTSLAQLQSDYTLGAGTLTLDLRQVPFPDGASTSVDVRVLMGEVLVQVPDDVEVVVEGRAGMGDVTVLDLTESGIAPRLTLTTGDSARTLRLDVSVLLGSIEVTP